MMNAHTYTRYLLLIGLLSSFISCRETDGFDGPSIIDQYGEFALVTSLEANRTSVDFQNGQTVHFTAEFNKNVSWTITITGQASGAVKEITGLSRKLDVDNASWNGSTTHLPKFRVENCTAVLTIENEPDVSESVTIEAVSPKNDIGELIADFESDAGNNIFFGNYEFELTPDSGPQNDIPAAQGNRYYLLKGTDAGGVPGNYFVGLIDIKASITGNTYFPVPTQDPSQLYFNAFLYSDGRPYTIAVIQFAYDTNDNGEYNDGIDQTFQLEGDFPLAHTGWIHISHTLAEAGMSEEHLNKIVAVRALLISNENDQPNPREEVGYGIDYLFFTANAPLNP